MSAASLSMLEQLMVAQAQECIFRGLLLTASSDTPNNSPAQLQLAQEAAQVRPKEPCPGASSSWPSCGHSGRRAGLRGTGAEWVWSQVRHEWAATDKAPAI